VQIAKLAISNDPFLGCLVLVTRDGIFDLPVRLTSTYTDDVNFEVLILQC
jgi:hypothetical protein